MMMMMYSIMRAFSIFLLMFRIAYFTDETLGLFDSFPYLFIIKGADTKYGIIFKTFFFV